VRSAFLANAKTALEFQTMQHRMIEHKKTGEHNGAAKLYVLCGLQGLVEDEQSRIAGERCPFDRAMKNGSIAEVTMITHHVI
jgi:hypothetical protein